MHAVDIDRLEPGMILAKTIFTSEGSPLLREGVALTDRFIRSLKSMQLGFVYIRDARAPEIQLNELVSPELRQEAIQAIRRAFGALEDGKGARFGEQLHAVAQVTNQIVQSILTRRDISIQMMDLKSHDNGTFEHSVAITVFGTLLGHRRGMTEPALRDLALGLVLHDIGKRQLPQELITRGAKTPAEEEQFKQHCRMGFDALLSASNLSAHAKIVSLQHHEHWDGSGYPKGLKGADIHPNAQIAAVVDMYDKLTAPPPGERRELPHVAVRTLMAHQGTRFNPEIIAAFASSVAPYPPGTYLELDDGTIGVVVDVDMSHAARPYVKVLQDAQGKDLGPAYPVVDLHANQGVNIRAVRDDVKPA